MASNPASIGDANVGNSGIGEGIGVTPRERATLLVSVLIISICALSYELIVATLSSYLLGDSVTQFSITIGLFLFAMGLGALVSRRIVGNEVRWFIIVELLTGFFGGISAALLYIVYASTSLDYYGIMFALIIAIGVCIGLEIPLLMRIITAKGELSASLADVLSLDYIGALIGSLAFPLLFLPIFGVTRTAFFMGVLNVLVAALNLQMFRRRLPRRELRTLWGAMGACAAVLIVGAVLSVDITRYFEQQLYGDLIVYRQQTPYQRLIVTRSGFDLRLYLDGNLQFSSRDEYRYHEMLVHPVMSAARTHDTVLVLGGGDGMVARELLKYPSVQSIIVVDLDPAMTALAREFAPVREINGGSMDDPRVTVVNQDAFKFVEESDALYPVVIIDLPDPNNESLSKLYSEAFYRLLRARMTPDGAFVTQAASPYFVRQAFWSIAHTIEAAGFQTLPLHTHVPSFGEWGFVIGSPVRPPQVSVPDGMALRYLTPEVLAAGMAFDPDTAEVPADVNTLDNPILARYYELGWQQWN